MPEPSRAAIDVVDAVLAVYMTGRGEEVRCAMAEVVDSAFEVLRRQRDQARAEAGHLLAALEEIRERATCAAER